jgi:hypothetical protein
MGISASSTSSAPAQEFKESRGSAREMREEINVARGKSLVEQHADKCTKKENDLGKRVFGYEKGRTVIGTANTKLRRELVRKVERRQRSPFQR